MDLVLGVDDVTYDDTDKTTGFVATILEAKYSVMATFFYRREEKIIDWLVESMADAIHKLMNGIIIDEENIFYDTEQKIESEFRDFLDANEMSTMFYELTESEAAYFIASTGGFTEAGEAGIRSKLPHPYASSNPARPAFIDTGLYQKSFRAWMEK